MKEIRIPGAAHWRGILALAGGYLLLILYALLLIVLNYAGGLRTYFAEQGSGFLSMGAYILLLFFIIYYYYYFEDRDFLVRGKELALIYTLIFVSVVACTLVGRYFSLYARPFALLGFLCLFLFNRRQAIVINFVFSMLLFVIDAYTSGFEAQGSDISGYASLLICFASGTLAIFVAGGVKTRGGMLITSVVLSLITAVMGFLVELPSTDLSDWIFYVAVFGYRIMGCMIAAVLALFVLPLFEVIFNRLTVFRLRELTSASAPMLQRLRVEAPGTFNHSLIVAQLAESCALAIGENAELARAAAYYHDVGKLKQPECFTENQTDYNVHDELTPELSADIIRSHAKDGYDLLMAAHLPREIADVAREHHGTLPIKYFYDKAMRLSGGDANIKDYSYLGPKPSTRIAAIIMIADASEAAARAIRDRSPENVERIVRSIIEERMDLDQFSECSITMRELSIIRRTLVEALSGVHHHRVKYPAIRFNRAHQAVKEEKEE